ncbi:MAG TPA: citrate/2-methylcitrate synthase, partial [Thermoplasmata archaeon]|nr:citrate/2-methylcitrate synthase [Thermoplasmata archaeon]
MPEEAVVQRGLEDVIALESRICFIDGKGGRLLYQGYDIRELASASTFEEVAYLLWYGRLPTSKQLADLRARLGTLRELPSAVTDVLDRIPPTSQPMDVLRTAVSALAVFEPAETKPGASSIGGAQRLTAVIPSILGYFHRRRTGLAALQPRPDLSQAAALLHALRDEPPSELEVRALDVALILHADHELNA